MEVTVSGVDVSALVKWGKPKEVNTKRGPRMLSKYKVKDEDPFWDLWRADNTGLKAAGVSVSKDEQTGEWCVLWWQELGKDELERRASSLVASRAADADIEVPAPLGCAYLPFQKAGIKFTLEKWGEI